jgi:hypothetical protein
MIGTSSSSFSRPQDEPGRGGIIAEATADLIAPKLKTKTMVANITIKNQMKSHPSQHKHTQNWVLGGRDRRGRAIPRNTNKHLKVKATKHDRPSLIIQ